MRVLCSTTLVLLAGFLCSEVAMAQRPGGGSGACNHSQSPGASYGNSQSPLASQYSPQSYLQPNYQQQAYMQRAYVQQAYLQQQMAFMQAAAESDRQIQARETERVANQKKMADARRSLDEKKRSQRAEKLASNKTTKAVN